MLKHNKPKAITVYRNRCIGCGYCLGESDNFWIISQNDGKVTSKDQPNTKEQTLRVTVPTEIMDRVILSCNVCPANVFAH